MKVGKAAGYCRVSLEMLRGGRSNVKCKYSKYSFIGVVVLSRRVRRRRHDVTMQLARAHHTALTVGSV
ncbi:hypothetical protein EVAR_5778_1 [Eumeta japonica]|uniref:Uncharacterized protein n=1 Tax=Eumeta variegata TaxID=151549 RepID=A0A4C1T4B6_EUMVA|nr:hypothetical protein EVAR_5778_1 [Eumeta japonica]